MTFIYSVHLIICYSEHIKVCYICEASLIIKSYLHHFSSNDATFVSSGTRPSQLNIRAENNYLTKYLSCCLLVKTANQNASIRALKYAETKVNGQ